MSGKDHNPRRRPNTQASLLGHVGGGRPSRRRQAPAAAEIERHVEIERDLALARDIQQGLLLEAVPRLPGWEINAVSLPARDLGGDLYDFIQLSDQTHGIMIGDVSGKGLPAALRMAVARTVFRHEARKGRFPAVTLAEINRSVLVDIPHGMVTMLYTTLDLRTGMLRIANAGHNFPIVINGTVNEVELTGLPLGVDDDIDYVELVHELHHGDTVFFFTDGVVEATNATEEMYGDERLHELLAQHAHARPRSLVARLLQELRHWSARGQADDITLVVVRRRHAYLGDELRLVLQDVLGDERADVLLRDIGLPTNDAPVSAWSESMAELVQRTQDQWGRGIARELNGQMRLVVEEYR